MGWLRLVGSLKLQVSFAKEPYKRDDILPKRPIILRRLLIVATPYDLYIQPKGPYTTFIYNLKVFLHSALRMLRSRKGPTAKTS
jgi:hypothetical protein